MTSTASTPRIAIACGGTGGHLFPGLAVAGQLCQRGAEVTLLISPKDVDQEAVKNVTGLTVVTLPAVALQNRNYISFARSAWKSWRAARQQFAAQPPHAVLAMGGFTAAPPVLAARKLGAKTFLHESNVIPGRANRLLARWVDEALVGFPEAAARLRVRRVTPTGTPVRPEFQPRDVAACRAELGLDAHKPVVLVMGGSQGASGINNLILAALPALTDRVTAWQWVHLTGPQDVKRVRAAYAARGFLALVKPFHAGMGPLLGAATAAVSRAGASSLAEIAAMRLPALLVPFPAAADNHQFFNARALEATGAARLLEQKSATPEQVAATLRELMEVTAVREKIQAALGPWHAPQAAAQIADIILRSINAPAAATLPGHAGGAVNLKAVA
ncbi:MAG TPA: undecaprenyldiphospho-muramoylpentapeptide beta-N-acetylglucosaminyltransferase [Dongiaceae bacterium]|nr:undecaprenyldiphospho-muramoylpentapeptide beta-N-acetylglucosaminyltransferase [Dongiaceae bacterium]